MYMHIIYIALGSIFINIFNKLQQLGIRMFYIIIFNDRISRLIPEKTIQYKFKHGQTDMLKIRNTHTHTYIYI